MLGAFLVLFHIWSYLTTESLCKSVNTTVFQTKPKTEIEAAKKFVNIIDGECPPSLKLSDGSNCQSLCQTDGDCDAGYKCCNDGCTTICIEPWLPRQVFDSAKTVRLSANKLLSKNKRTKKEKRFTRPCSTSIFQHLKPLSCPSGYYCFITIHGDEQSDLPNKGGCVQDRDEETKLKNLLRSNNKMKQECLDEGEIYEHNKTFQRNCRKCICYDAVVFCDRKLCDDDLEQSSKLEEEFSGSGEDDDSDVISKHDEESAVFFWMEPEEEKRPHAVRLVARKMVPTNEGKHQLGASGGSDEDTSGSREDDEGSSDGSGKEKSGDDSEKGTLDVGDGSDEDTSGSGEDDEGSSDGSDKEKSSDDSEKGTLGVGDGSDEDTSGSGEDDEGSSDGSDYREDTLESKRDGKEPDKYQTGLLAESKSGRKNGNDKVSPILGVVGKRSNTTLRNTGGHEKYDEEKNRTKNVNWKSFGKLSVNSSKESLFALEIESKNVSGEDNEESGELDGGFSGSGDLPLAKKVHEQGYTIVLKPATPYTTQSDDKDEQLSLEDAEFSGEPDTSGEGEKTNTERQNENARNVGTVKKHRPIVGTIVLSKWKNPEEKERKRHKIAASTRKPSESRSSLELVSLQEYLKTTDDET